MTSNQLFDNIQITNNDILNQQKTMTAKQSEPLTKCIHSSIESKLEFQFILLCIDWMRIYTQQSDLSNN